MKYIPVAIVILVVFLVVYFMRYQNVKKSDKKYFRRQKKLEPNKKVNIDRSSPEFVLVF